MGRISRFVLFVILGLSFSCQDTIENHDIEICKHFNDGIATIIQVSDQYFDQSATYNSNRQFSAETAEFYALKNNIPIHVFESNVEKGLKDFIQMGRGGVSAYYPSCYENYSTQKLDSILSLLSEVYGRKPTSLSYGCGKTQYSDSLPEYILAGRNSSYGKPKELSNNVDVCTYYGESAGERSVYPVDKLGFRKNRLCSTRSWANVISNGISVEESLQFIREEIKKTINNNGFYVDFMHWHIDEIKGKNAQTFVPQLFKAIGESVEDNYISKLDYNQANEYLYAKESIDSISLTEHSDYYDLRVVLKKRFENVDYNVIATPVSFKTAIDISSRMKKNIGGGDNLHSITESNGKMVINAYLDFDKRINNIKISKRGQPKFKTKNLDIQIDGSEVYSDTPFNYTLFVRDKNFPEHQVRIIERGLNFNDNYKLDLTTKQNDQLYYLGVINKLGESKMLNLNI